MIFAISRSYFAEFSRNVPLQNGRKLFFGQIFLFTLLTHCLRLLQAYPLSICLLFSSPILLSSILFISMISSILPPPPLSLCSSHVSSKFTFPLYFPSISSTPHSSPQILPYLSFPSPSSSDIYESLKLTGYDAPSADNVVVEIFDILACNDPRFDTLDIFISSAIFSLFSKDTQGNR